mmetsp:Transcript_1195/g.1832  ORF Transcript_1195/g.1832 Transcript_1195/m.1832 type:complete len:753 (-) Transcript_1195:150-2408(-)|eukprot:CAMPEP_0172423736 /NCGR_PEP_ID=MMETSP1064-20121228/17703_1 /TAXON_ID=202472 /ORGANISM="Aulacoseira subarctica , Strain CCAP 1002/5" /LENGTH=752 /DNA_ID=CAMNT_0013165259 /DNA_START=31 /DNA_END=2289 /DNA_ORIENTATION=+
MTSAADQRFENGYEENEEEKVYAEDDDEDDRSASLEDYYSDTPLKPQVKYPPRNDSFDSALIVMNLPRIPEGKVDKLLGIITKIFSKLGTLATSEDGSFNGVYMPLDNNIEPPKTCGFAFVQYTNAEDAKKAATTASGYALDKNHSFITMLYSEALEIQDISPDFTEPEPEPYQEPPNTDSWLLDDNQRDSFAIRHGQETAVYWCDGKPSDPLLDYDGRREKEAGINWCDFYCHWSPKGRYLATLIPAKGVILWGGDTYEKLGRFPSPGVHFVLFSPQERYLLTSSENRRDPQAIKIFDLHTQKLLRAFPMYPQDFLTEEQEEALKFKNFDAVPPPPLFQWSHDDQYIARMGKGLISIYELSTMKLLDKRSLNAEGIHEFQWSPKDNIIAYWAPEVNNAPAHVDLVEIPSRKFLRQKNLFNVTKCSMAWQSEGDFLGVKVTRHTKSKKTLYNNFELFRIRDAGIPVEMLDVKDAVMSFAWEPRGSRFSIVHAENPSSTKVNVSFYDMNKITEVTTISTLSKKSKTELKEVAELNKVGTLEGKQCNSIFWSPAGGVILLASLGDQASGTLEFYDVDNKSLSVKEHYRANEVFWDPSGRTVATCVIQPIGGGHFKFSLDNGFILWSFQGKQLYQASFETFYQFQWRPRQHLLSKDDVNKVIKNIKKYEKRFDKEDKDRLRARHIEETRGKRLLRDKFRETMARLKAFHDNQAVLRIELYGGYDSNDESNYETKEISVETILSSKDEVVQNLPHL